LSTPKEEDGWGVMVTVAIFLVGIWVNVAVISGDSSVIVVVGEGEPLQAAKRRDMGNSRRGINE
jgi:hypothetical protein